MKGKSPKVAFRCAILFVFLVVVVNGSTWNALDSEASPVSCETPKVTLEAGTVGSSTIYANGTSAFASVAAPAPTPTYYPNSYNIQTGSYVSGTIPTSVETVDADYFVVRSAGTATSNTGYYPSGYSLFGSTTLVSGTTSDLASNDAVYMAFRSYASNTSAQTLYAHQETTTIGGTNYYLQKLDSADNGTSLSASMAATGRQNLGKFVYPLTGVSSIPESAWTIYYRAWRDAGPSIGFDGNSSGNNGGGSASVSWSHTTGSGSNRIMIVGVSIRTTTVSVLNITYGSQSLTFIRADTHASATVRSELWYLIAPNSGTATVTVNLSATSKAVGAAVTYTGVAQTPPIDANGGGTGTSNSPSQSVTVNTANSWLVGNLAITGSGTTVSSEGSGQTMRWDNVTTGASAASRNRGHGSGKGPVGTGSQSMSWTLSASDDWAVSLVSIKPAPSAAGHADVDVLIRQSNGTVRTTIATDVANSTDLTSTATTLSGTYSWTAYTVVNQTDYLEIDYYADITTAASSMSAYLRIDDGSLSTSDQTRGTNIKLPSEFTSEVEFTGTSNTAPWYQLVWNVDSAWTAGSVAVTIQVYNYTLGGYSPSGNGYDSYTSSATSGTDETRTQTVTANPTQFRDVSGNWKIKVKGVKSTATQFNFKADWIEFKPSYYSEYTASTEFLFSSMTKNTPTQLNFTIVSEHDVANVSVTLQIWNYSSSTYATSGEGYLAYTSTSPNETKLLSINTNPQNFTPDASARVKITGVLTTTVQYQQKVNQVQLLYSYNSSSSYDYVLKIVNHVPDAWNISLRLYGSANITRLSNMTMSFHDGTMGEQIIITGGSVTQSEGALYDLAGSSTVYISISNLQASTSEVSYLYVYLKIQNQNTTTYNLLIVLFEIT